MNIYSLRKIIGREEFDYQQLISALSDYTYPRDKISRWLNSGELIRVKKGLYIFGKTAAIHPFSHEVLANQIYGPSAISLHYALAYYGLIPERVNTMTSITPKRNKLFTTSIGTFIYHYLNYKKYAVGIRLENLSSQRSFLIATPEKALCDVIYLIDRSVILDTPEMIEHYLLYDLRMDKDSLKKFDIKILDEINQIYQDRRLNHLIQWIKS